MRTIKWVLPHLCLGGLIVGGEVSSLSRTDHSNSGQVGYPLHLMLLYESVARSFDLGRAFEGVVFCFLGGFLAGESLLEVGGHSLLEEDGLEEVLLFCLMEEVALGLGLRAEGGLGLVVSCVVGFLLDLGLRCYFYPGFCVCTHVRILLTMSLFVCFTFRFCVIFFRFVEFVVMLLTAGVPVWLAPLVAVSQGVRHGVRFLTVRLRLSLNLIVGHIFLGLSVILGGIVFVFCAEHKFLSPVVKVRVPKVLLEYFGVSGEVELNFTPFLQAVECLVRLGVLSLVLLCLGVLVGFEFVYTVFQVCLFGLLLLFYSADNPLLSSVGRWARVNRSLGSIGFRVSGRPGGSSRPTQPLIGAAEYDLGQALEGIISGVGLNKNPVLRGSAHSPKRRGAQPGFELCCFGQAGWTPLGPAGRAGLLFVRDTLGLCRVFYISDYWSALEFTRGRKGYPVQVTVLAYAVLEGGKGLTLKLGGHGHLREGVNSNISVILRWRREDSSSL